MNRLVLIGNGFDLAHGLPTSYKDFINWYLAQRIHDFHGLLKPIAEDPLCTFEDLRGEVWNVNAFNGISLTKGFNINHFTSGIQVYEYLFQNPQRYKITPSELFKRIILGVESKTWAGIEQDYYDILKEYAFRDKKINPIDPPIKALNQQLRFVQEKLVEYLKEVSEQKIHRNNQIWHKIYEPIKTIDISVAGEKYWDEHIKYWLNDGLKELGLKKEQYEIASYGLLEDVKDYKEKPMPLRIIGDYPMLLRLPDSVMLLDFNYTDTCRLYEGHMLVERIQIHGNIDNPENIIFGYGDELDEKFKELKEHKNNACLSHIKSICYLNAPEYRKVLSFIESAPFQVLIMGHSCGNSDRTLLNTIFEHKNCVSIKPYYYEKDGKDNYTELVQHISRNFTDMKLMRDRVVNKTQCEPLVQE